MPAVAEVTEQVKQRARWRVQKRVQRGSIVVPDRCEHCDRLWADAGQWEGHHPDYLKPLDVTFLCRPCHREVHANDPDHPDNVYAADIPL